MMSADDVRIARLKYVVAAQNNCEVKHVGSHIVERQLAGGRVWRTTVEIFKLARVRRRAMHCYAWFEEQSPTSACRTMLKIPPIDSPDAAVQAALQQSV